MDSATRADMEARFDHDFSNVRLHSDPKAGESARAVNALAYTVGSDVVLGAGQTSPHTDAGRKVLAHELTHVVQQSGGLGRQILQRWTANNCTLSQRVYVDDAFAKSFDGLSTAARRLEKKPTTDRVKQALWLAFRSDSEATAKIIRSRIKVLKENITSTRVTCSSSKKDPDCGTDYGYYDRQSKEIFLCMPAFSDMDPVGQANTLTHEAAHKYLKVTDTGYFTKKCEETDRIRSAKPKDSGTEGDNPAHRLNNADAYACFVHFLTGIGTKQLTEQAAAYRGDNLTLEDPEKRIYTRTGTPSRTTIKLTGVPNNSGFRFKWKLIAGDEEFSVASARGGNIRTDVFDEDALEVYIPSNVRARLEEKNVQKATLQCEVELYRPLKGTPDPPVITKTLELPVYHEQDPFDPSRP